ncbi:hypothetical protein bthur0009_56320 [Bacillus thuringiensis serovar andalousiensis BGSC 4AW1]|uniref:Crystaline entomocidal protoxin n=2 Tax=Bacillaceae TaxID=186817 RepID=V9I0M9_BACTU|nr:insecticidal delta-endotoxin Cry8Ea1 family protein [Bacillus thuringiensis]AEB52311.1 parasporin 3-like protein [Bacillus thuringiensis]AEJ35085.1 Cry0211 [Bacillus thuringiensis]EEM68355.1 hypothetical protein bthur0009_56320 [Bacillus thuringiensis serovar andalousiensis BGSC 4AW1]
MKNGGLQMSRNDSNNDLPMSVLSRSQSKYLMTNMPLSELIHLSEQEWLDMYRKWKPMSTLDIDAEIGVTAALGIISFILSVSNPVSAAAVGIASILVPILWPTPAASPDPDIVWKSMIKNVENLIDEKIAQLHYDLAFAKLNGLKAGMVEFNQAIENLNQNPSSSGLKEAVRTKYRSLDSLFTYSMPQFAVNTAEIQLLPVYVEAATLHLLHKRTGFNFGKSWDLDPIEVESLYNDLIRLTGTYTDHCIRWYNRGLENLNPSTNTINYKPANMRDCNKYPWVKYDQSEWYYVNPSPNMCTTALSENSCKESMNVYNTEATPRWYGYRASQGEYQGLENWNSYNAFRRNLTTLVLDIIAVWPTFDPKLYKYGIKAELTRKLYSDICGTTYRSDPSQNSVNAIESKIVSPPSFFEWLDQIDFHTIVRDQGPNVGDFTSGELLTGVQQTVRRTLANPSLKPLEGKAGEQPTKIVRLTPNTFDITEVSTKQWFEPREIVLKRAGTNILTVGTITDERPYWSSLDRGLIYPKVKIYDQTQKNNQIPKTADPNKPQSEWDYSHRLSWFWYYPIREDAPMTYPNDKQIGAMACVWTHMSVDPTNSIAPDKITQIPAVKGNGMYFGGEIIKGLDNTGGDLVKLYSTSDRNQLQVDLKIPARMNNISGYQIRIRYASKQSGDIYLELERSVNSQWRLSTIPPTYSGNNLTSNSFGYHDALVIASQENAHPATLRIRNNDSPSLNTEIIIDKIEFIPIEGSLEEYEAKQKLEKAREVVNILFDSGANFEKA